MDRYGISWLLKFEKHLYPVQPSRLEERAWEVGECAMLKHWTGLLSSKLKTSGAYKLCHPWASTGVMGETVIVIGWWIFNLAGKMASKSHDVNFALLWMKMVLVGWGEAYNHWEEHSFRKAYFRNALLGKHFPSTQRGRGMEKLTL